ncbi:hypothetical protein swp_0468 [Shewanella piezotolerans WP3]|uniref:Uncharacterized protein n=2 Tax=Shewanella TaxID=22 RepID=B8CI23_SHEPW|nr:hypothetical protein swp_0468 [Shewanella piezotolerans WP3]
MKYMISILLLFASAYPAKAATEIVKQSCLSSKQFMSEQDIMVAQEYLYGLGPQQKIFAASKGELAVVLNDLDYINQLSDKEELFNAYYATLATRPEMATKVVAQFDDANYQTASGMSLLMAAAECGNLDIMTILLAEGANINVKMATSQYDALMVAVIAKEAESVRFLIENGADCKSSILANGMTLL